ncbi:UNVERIFIED_CONTAM: hypothetical protein Slati_3690300 [Sesamum latifolium]|uniref:Transposase MuDR plant domain-containing protein n=1 Tax=Sesamum latifolium TaxID=2727402 RepID=A0AAW2U158_9LAMI
MYEKCGGKKFTLNFYYCDPTQSLDRGLRKIKAECPDICMVDIQNMHRGLDVPIKIYVEEEDGEPIQIVDSQDANDDQGFVFEGVSQDCEDCEGQGMDRAEFEGDTERQDCEPGGKGKGVQSDDCEGKEPGYQEFDDSSDEDYVQPTIDSDSDTPSLVLEDIEVESDDDIFSNKNPTKLELVKKLKKVMKDSQKAKLKQKMCDVREEGWASDCDDEEDLESLPGSDEETQQKCPVFKESTSLKNLNLVVGMKFKDAKQFREVLRDWCVRNGYDIEFIKNETSRITAKCKGNHTCARTYDNSLAKATYLATRMESSIRDHPDIPIQQLKNRILRKCNVDVSRFKVMRAKKKALEVIRGSDALQYDKLWIIVKLETWSWFLSEMLDDIGGLGTSKWSFISDRQKGLIEALKDLVPDSEHRFCTRHMYQNFKLKFKSVELKEYFWKAASTANKKDFERFMKKIQEIDPKLSEDVETASEWLEKINPEHWVRAFFPVHSKSDILVNNLCESFNSYILEARDKPIITIGTKRAQIDDFVEECYKKETYLRVYSEMIHAVPGAKDYINTSFEPLKPPAMKKQRGRPKKLRRRGPDELSQSKGSLPEEIPQGSQAPPTSKNKPLDKSERNKASARQKGRNQVPLRKSAASREEVTYKGPRNATLLGMTAPIQTTAEQTPMTTDWEQMMGLEVPLISILEKGRYKKRPTITQASFCKLFCRLGALFYSGI